MIVDYRLCNVLISDGLRSEAYPHMYVRKSSPAYTRADGVSVLCDQNYAKYDFLTYFNAFSNAKWRRYTRVDNVHLHLVACGTFDVRLVSCEQTMARPKITVLAEHRAELEDFETVEYAFPDSKALFLGFEIIAYGEVQIKEAYYFTKVDEALLRPVELSVVTTTFQKEEYVIPNIKLFKEQVLGCEEPIAEHFTLHVVDNGRTLDSGALESDRVFVHPNPNVGGAGGFTRGMIESMEQEPKATHVLLMDDDVQISPESLKRTYNLLALVNDAYRDAFLSGAMLSFERQDEFYEDVGYVRHAGFYGPVKETRSGDPGAPKRFIVSDLEDVVKLESIVIHQKNRYAGWWYCCIPMRSIERNGLPLPVFIRGDDAEYGNRCADRFITMSGICIWHLTLGFKFRAALERYQVPRNSLIAQATTGVYQDVDFMEELHVKVGLDLKTFNYDGAELGIEAVEDYLRGPEFLKHVNSAKLNSRLAQKNEALVPLDQIDDPLLNGLEVNPSLLYGDGNRSLVERAYDFLTFNGQRGPRALKSGGLGVIAYDGWYYPPNEIRGKDALLAVTPDGTEGVLRKKDRVRFNELLKRYKAAVKEFYERREEVAAQWAAAKDELTSVEFWKWYLEDQAK